MMIEIDTGERARRRAAGGSHPLSRVGVYGFLVVAAWTAIWHALASTAGKADE